ncbi:MAG: hypothetical protein J4215_06440 [Candidatus Diapherotrites archaeon]|uniref:Uncharacterized protein n=1 Tax=Candidatus Iainarchaeum sp. TaxID=3101447 RepID=A0A8T4L8H4_9ARCH|nr:hypothetical protein [Candidatus Diapherotrites archaeon]
MGFSGQTAMIELGIGVVVVLLIVVTLLNFWNLNFSVANEVRRMDDFERSANTAIDRVAETKGDPLNWPAVSFSDVNSVGIARYPLVVDENKLIAFVFFADNARSPQDYNRVRLLLGLRNADFQFRVYRMDSNQRIEEQLFRAGKFNIEGNSYIIQKQRFVSIGDQPRIIEMKFFLAKQGG